MKYFIEVVDFVNANILWVLVAFGAAWLVETIVFVIRKFALHKSFETDGYYVAIATNVVVILGAYILACLGFGLVNCIKDQDWHFWQHFWGFVQGPAYKWIAITVGIIGAIVMFFVYKAQLDSDGLIGPLLLAVLTAGLGVIALTIVGFLLYVIISFLIILFKVLWFVVSGFFVSMWGFVSTYWPWVLGILLIPGILYGAIKAFINYLNSFKDTLF